MDGLMDDPRIELLREVSERRNELLREMYHMLKRRENIGPIFNMEEEDEEDLDNFLAKFDLNKNPETGTINNLPHNELFAPPSPVTPSPVTPPKRDVFESDSDDELLLVGTPSNKSNRRSHSLIHSEPQQTPEPQPLEDADATEDEITSTVQASIAAEEEPDWEPEHAEEAAVAEMIANVEEHQEQTDTQVQEGGDEETAGENREEQVEMKEGPDSEPQPEMMLVDEPSSVVSPQRSSPPLDEVKVEDPIIEHTIPEVQPEVDMPVAEDVEMEAPGDSEPPVQPASFQPLPQDEGTSPETPVDLPPSVIYPPATLLSYNPIPATPRHNPVIIQAPSSPSHIFSSFEFNGAPDPPPQPVFPHIIQHQFPPEYTLPPIKSLPVEFNRTAKPSKIQRRKEKEREKEQKGEKSKDKEKEKDDFVPMEAVKWGATVRINPVHRRLSKSTKCLSTRDWTIGMTELRLIRTLDKIEMLKANGHWSFRQPKKQRGLGQTTKTHWDYLLEEMKWMRTDFREERKWKLALAFTLSTAVLEWHAAGSPEERVARGICVLWKPPVESEGPVMEEVEEDSGALEIGDGMDIDMQMNSQTQKSLVGDYGSDDDDDDDDQDKNGVIDSLDSSTMLQAELDAPKDESEEVQELEPKTEDLEDSSALQNDSMDVDSQPITIPKPEVAFTETALAGLKESSSDPLLGGMSKSTSQSTVGDSSAKSKSSKINLYAPLRERITYSDVDKLFIDLDDFRLSTEDGPKPDDTLDSPTSHLPAAELTSIFPDLVPYGLFNPLVDGKQKKSQKKQAEELRQRVDETDRSKISLVSRFMHTKPTLISALQPTTYWKDGEWKSMDDSAAVSCDIETIPAKVPDDIGNALFEHKEPAYSAMTHLLLKTPRKYQSTHLWTTDEDNLLKTLVDRYAGNWNLVSEAFNGSRLTVPTDKRSYRDCFERWREKWGPPVQRPEAAVPGPDVGTPPPVTSQMTTRGVKRLASTSISSATSVAGTEPKKRRRHAYVQESIRKATKKRLEAQQKQNTRKPQVTHETHGQFNKMPKYSPSELSRMKYEKENNELQIHKRQIAVAQQQAAQAQAAQLAAQQNGRGAGSPINGGPAPGTSTQPNPAQRPAGAAPGPAQQQVVPQIRNQQVNISQQQRIASASRLLPAPQQQQLIQAQAQAQAQATHARQLQQAQQAQLTLLLQQQAAQAAQAAGQSPAALPVAQNGNSNGNVNGNGSTAAQMSPPQHYVSRDATSSPHAHTSPPRSTSTPSNAMNSPRPPSAQAQITPHQAQQLQAAVHAQLQQQQQQNQNANNRAQNMTGHYYLPPTNNNLTNLAGYDLTQPQLRMLQQQQQIQQVQQQQQQQQQQQNGFPS